MSVFDELGEAEAFAAGQFVQREKYLAKLTRDAVKARQEVMEALRSGFAYANGQDTSAPEMDELVALFKRATVEQARTLDSLMRDRPMPPGEERDALLAAPFGEPEPNGNNESKGLPRPEPRALTNKKASLPKDPPKRKRGRPSKEEVLLREKEKAKGDGRPDSATEPGESPGRPESDQG